MSTGSIVNISGVTESGAAKVAADICVQKKGRCLIITPSHQEAVKMASDLSFFCGRDIRLMPKAESPIVRYEAKSNNSMMERLEILKMMRTEDEYIVVSSAGAALKKMSPCSRFEEIDLKFRTGEEVPLSVYISRLSSMGYERVPAVEGKGQFSLRGDILDIYAPDGAKPFRIEFFGDEVDSIRSFDLETQRSVSRMDSVDIYPARELNIHDDELQRAADKIRKLYTSRIRELEKQAKELPPDEKESREHLSHACDRLEESRDELLEYMESMSNVQFLENYVHYFFDAPEVLWDYMGDGTVIVSDPDRIIETVREDYTESRKDLAVLMERGEDIPQDAGILSDENDFIKVYRKEAVYVLSPFSKQIKGADRLKELRSIKMRPVITFNNNLQILEHELNNYISRGVDVTIGCSESRIEGVREMLASFGLEEKIKTRKGLLSSGFEFVDEKICYISDREIFGSTGKKKRKKAKLSNARPIKAFADIQKGDYVVHEAYGIGKFVGIEQQTVLGEKGDYLKIRYAGTDMLYVPVGSMDLIQKYVGGDKAKIKLNRLSGSEWKKTKAKAKIAVAKMAQELLDLAASRQANPGYAFGEDTSWQYEFEEDFPYEETDDQLKCIREIKADMERPVPMDRLLCGDVGFGKTEVAARAVFKCLADGKQAAIMVPTTILANQHYYTLKERFEKFPFKVEVLSRFNTPSQQKEILERVSRGETDLVIGTHRLLSKDVSFKDLGLLVVDEEQRFGVSHKERLKQMKHNVDVLTLSATPIPRTLHMSLVGLRDMSLIEEPPEDRMPVQTYVVEEDNDIIRDVIMREISRGGQVFVVYNRIKGIAELADRISTLVPEATVATGHGRMSENHLENIMLDFINGNTDVLVATTIIEAGLDIQNANTLIVLDAENFGLSQLYQIRGRVGRSGRAAYAYLMHKRGKILTDIARQRLKAIRRFTEFGSGFKLAMRDLELRGAGNILGTEQSGHMINVGYELYCKLVEDAVRGLKGDVVRNDEADTTIALKLSAFIPSSYISDEILKLEMYKKIADVVTKEDESEIIDELIDRFGEPPAQVLDLIKVSAIRHLAIANCVTRIEEKAGKVELRFDEKNRLRGPLLVRLSNKYGMKIFFHGGVRPFMRLSIGRGEDKLEEVRKLLADIDEGAEGSEGAAC